jgi:TonB family protein
MPTIPTKLADKYLVRHDPPEYPVVAKINYIQGHVRLMATVSRAGKVAEAHVLSGHPFLAVAALNAVRRWVFRPAESRPGPADFQTYVNVRFWLRAKRVDHLPLQPEHDLKRQIRPPELVAGPPTGRDGDVVRMRVLVGSEGQAVDSQAVQSPSLHLEEARRVVANWTFRPAHWGAIAVPWYVEVDVPLPSWSGGQTAADSSGH